MKVYGLLNHVFVALRRFLLESLQISSENLILRPPTVSVRSSLSGLRRF